MGKLETFRKVLALPEVMQSVELTNKLKELYTDYLDLLEENNKLKTKLKDLSEEIKNLKKAKVKEKDLEYSPKGFFTIKGEHPKIPYCSCCWKKESKLIPLSQYFNWWNYKCGNCNSEVTVMNEKGKPLNQQGEK